MQRNSHYYIHTDAITRRLLSLCLLLTLLLLLLPRHGPLYIVVVVTSFCAFFLAIVMFNWKITGCYKSSLFWSALVVVAGVIVWACFLLL
jgi:hypothetical protein